MSIISTFATLMLAEQVWEFDYNGNTYTCEADIAHITYAEFETLDGTTVSVADIITANQNSEVVS